MRRKGVNLHALAHVIGPWPIRPAPITAFLTIFTVVWAGARISTMSDPSVLESVRLVLLAISSSLLMGLVLVAAERGARHFTRRFPGYLFALTVCAAVGASFRVATGQLPSDPFPSPLVAFVFSWLRLLLFLVTAQAIIGLVTRRVEQQVAHTDAALQVSNRLKQRLVESDERTRAQVATLLHDRVQAGLIAACLELTDAIESRGVDPAPTVRDVVNRLEAMRDLDVRQAARTLSPDLSSLDLRTALEDLAAQYLPAMQTDVVVSSNITSRLDRTHMSALLAVYRITEQSLLNAAVHGRARRCQVSVRLENNSLQVVVRDNGRGLEDQTQAGLGTFIIDTWVEILGGSWQLERASAKGAVVTAILPIDALAETTTAFPVPGIL